MNDTLPPAQMLRECFTYDADEGIVRWKTRPPHHFSSVRAMNASNSRFAGKEVSSVSTVGYVRVGLCDTQYYLHRIIWKLVTGEDPGDLQINHKDGNKLNNSWANIEAISHSENVKHAFDTGLVDKKGESHHNSKLNNQIVTQMRLDHESGSSITDLSDRYEVNRATVYDAVKRITWKHLG